MKVSLILANLISISFAMSSIMSFALSANAQNVTLGAPTLSGNGCPAGTASASLDPSLKAVSVLFDSMIVSRTSADLPSPIMDASCTMSIPVRVDAGWNLDATQMIVRGVLMSTSPAAIAYMRVTAQLNNAIGFVVPPEVFGVKTLATDQDVNINAVVKPNARAYCQPQRNLTFTLSTGYTHRKDRLGRWIGLTNFDFYSAIDSADVGGVPVEINYQVSRCR